MFKRGDKVVPINKSNGCSLDDSSAWKYSKARGYMYFKYKEGNRVICTAEMENGGDYFLESDLIPYQLDEYKALHMLLTGEINDTQYKQYVGKV